MEVYAKLFDIVADNFASAGCSMEYEKATFLRDVESEPRKVDVAKFLELPNPQFFQAVFVNTFKRLPDAKEKADWEKRMELPREAFQETFLKSLCRSSVVAVNHTEFVNNPYFRQKKGVFYKLFGSLYGLTDKSFLRVFGKKLPKPIQKIIRKVFL